MEAKDTMKPAGPGMMFTAEDPKPSTVGEAINPWYLADESECVAALLAVAKLSDARREQVTATAERLVRSVRANRVKKGGLDAFLKKYDLSSKEGVVLMCLAEALLRIPDADTADKLIADKLASGDWKDHLGTSDSLFVNASTWGLMLTGKLMRPEDVAKEDPGSFMGRMVARAGEPVVRAAMRQAMRIMGHQFVMGRTIEEAMERSLRDDNRLYRHSFDMLGEAALTAEDAQRYFDAYSDAIASIGKSVPDDMDMTEAPSISVKLSALHPRYEFTQRARVLDELSSRLLTLAERARTAGIALTVDAEEADRLEVSMEVFEAVYRSQSLDGWNGLGLALQGYQKRSIHLARWLIDLARQVGRQMPIRLVKGAYWDTEIKRAQEDGLAGYPVFTRKPSTDVSYLACARVLLEAGDAVYPQFATHNAHTVASVLHMAGDNKAYEFQRLHGMGEELYEEIVGPDKMDLACRVYAPVGNHEDLLPYLVRRLLENGANTSFVNRIIDESAPISDIVADPVALVEELDVIPHPKIPLPNAIYGAERVNSRGVNLADRNELEPLARAMSNAVTGEWKSAPVVGGKVLKGEVISVINPYDRDHIVGAQTPIDEAGVDSAVELAVAAQPGWDATPAAHRGALLRRAADLFEQNGPELMARCVKEAGKSIPDCVSELREAVDFLRYYAARAEADFGKPAVLPGPTGESNKLSLHGKGAFVCISPWNFPLAIFTGQVAAALASGNTVLAKPAEQTSLVAAKAVELLYEAGIPPNVLHYTPGKGSLIGARAVADPRIAGVVFTGSTATAQTINKSLAERGGSIATLIAETGGQNAMLVDSSALPEQVVLDVVQSSFNSAGQRCSALRVLFLQEEIAPRVIELLTGYMKELKIGDPSLLSTDVGPVIDITARDGLENHAEEISQIGEVIYRCELPEQTKNGTFVAPLAVEIDGLDLLTEEHFGPILHIVRFKASELEKAVQSINDTGFGLTLGVHSRIDSTAAIINKAARVGNVYVNRNMIGAVVGVQPFGGCNLSGTGPKAGGPHYLHRFATERTLTVNMAAVGGNASLLSLESE